MYEKVRVMLHQTIPRAFIVTEFGAGGNASYKILLVPDCNTMTKILHWRPARVLTVEFLSGQLLKT
jgi:hypothetical protein